MKLYYIEDIMSSVMSKINPASRTGRWQMRPQSRLIKWLSLTGCLYHIPSYQKINTKAPIAKFHPPAVAETRTLK
jgi:hypothetical protein